MEAQAAYPEHKIEVGSVQFNLVEKSPLTLNRQKTECNA
jgi:hypothetical protein